MLVNRSNLQTDVKNQKDLNTLQDTLKNNKDYCVLQIATTGFKPSEADIIKLTCIYIKNNDGKYRPADKLEFNIAASPQNIIKAEMIILVKQVLIYRHIKMVILFQKKLP